LSPVYPSVNRFFLVGKTLKSHGTGGQLRLMIEDQFKTYMKKGSFVYVDIDGSKVPYLIGKVEDGAHFIISFEDIQNKRESDLLAGKDLWIPLDNVKSRHQRSPKNLQDKWIEFDINDDVSNERYKIIRVEEFPQQLMAVIMIGEKEHLIPLSDQLISSIDKENKIINMEIPAGLLDL